MDGTQLGFFAAEPLFDGRGLGFALFGPWHLLCLLYSLVLIAVVTRIFLGMRRGIEWGSPRRTMLLIIAGIPLALLISQDCIMVSSGVFRMQWWPLHTCNLCEYLALVYALWPNRFCGEALFTLGIIGAIMALVFPGWAYCPLLSWPSVCGFTEHSLVIAYALMIALGQEHHPQLRGIWRPSLLIAIYAPLIYIFDKAYDTNYFFLNQPATGSPMVPVAAVLGSPGYIAPFIAALLGSWVVLYLIWMLLEHLGVPAKLEHLSARN